MLRTRRVSELVSILAVAGLLAGCGSGATGSPSAAAPGTNETPGGSASSAPAVIKVGISGSFSGATAFYGQEAQKGAQIGADELNAKGGAYTYQIVTADDECTPDGGASAYGNLIDVSKVDVILGSPCSAATLGGMPLAAQGQVPNVVASSTSPTITQQAGVGGNQYVWRANLGDGEMATVWSKYIADQGVTKIATLAVNNDYGRGAITAYKADFPQVGLQVVAEQYYTQGGGDFRSQLTAISGSGAQAMLVVGAHQDAAVMMRQFKELGLTLKVFTRGDVVSTGFQDAAGDPNLGNGIQEANNWDSTYSAYPDFESAYHAKYGGTAQSYAVQAWIGMQVIAQAVEAGGPGRAGIEAGLAKVDWNSPIGPIKFDDHHQAHPDMFILGFQDGKIVLIKRISAAS